MSGGIIVVGGGPAGAATAWHLARAGRDVTVVERDAAPAHRVCGEFLGGDALAELAALGLDVHALDGAGIHEVRLVQGGAVAASARLPFAAAALSRRVLDAALLDAAGRAGARIVRGRAVRSVRGRWLDVEGWGAVRADALVLATGKHDMRGARRRLARPPEPLVGFKVHATLLPEQVRELAGAVELMLFRDAYAGLQMVDDATANLCLLADENRLARAGSWRALLDGLGQDSPHLARRLNGALCWPRPLAIARVPYGFLHRPTAADEDGVFRVGDQMGVIASFTGDGMGIALHTARLAAQCLLQGQDARAYHRQAAAALGRPIRLASMMYSAGRVPVLQAAMLRVARRFPGGLARLGQWTRVSA